MADEKHRSRKLKESQAGKHPIKIACKLKLLIDD